MKKDIVSYKYSRIYDFIDDNNLKAYSSGAIRRKDRIPIAVVSSCLIVAMDIVLFKRFSDYFIYILVFSILSLSLMLQITNTGIISLLNIINLNKIRKKLNKNIFEKVIVIINKDKNDIGIRDRHLRYFKDYYFIWTKRTYCFIDSKKNWYYFTISVNGMRLKIRFANKAISNHVDTSNIQFYYNGSDFIGIETEKEFFEKLRVIFADIKNKIAIQL